LLQYLKKSVLFKVVISSRYLHLLLNKKISFRRIFIKYKCFNAHTILILILFFIYRNTTTRRIL